MNKAKWIKRFPYVALGVVAVSGAWVFGGILRFWEWRMYANHYKLETRAWGWTEEMMVGYASMKVFVASSVMTLVLVAIFSMFKRQPSIFPRWYMVALIPLALPLGVGFYISLYGWGLLPRP